MTCMCLMRLPCQQALRLLGRVRAENKVVAEGLHVLCLTRLPRQQTSRWVRRVYVVIPSTFWETVNLR